MMGLVVSNDVHGSPRWEGLSQVTGHRHWRSACAPSTTECPFEVASNLLLDLALRRVARDVE